MTLTARTITRLLVPVLAVVMLATASPARADHISIDIFPNWNKAANTAFNAWDGYVDHCPTVYLWAYESGEHWDSDDAYAFAYMGECDIYFNADMTENYRYAWFCSVMVHEMGHVAGFDHNGDGRDIMHSTNEVYWRKCLGKKQARKFKNRGEIIDRSIDSWAYASAATAPEPDHVTRRDVSRAIESGELHVAPLGRVDSASR